MNTEPAKPRGTGRVILLGALLLAAALALAAWRQGSGAFNGIGGREEIAVSAASVDLHAVAETFVRPRATAIGTKAVRPIARGDKLNGTVELGENGTSRWLRLSDGSGFVSVINLSRKAPPALTQSFGSSPWTPQRDIKLYAAPGPLSAGITTAAAGRVYKVAGVTDNGYAEIKLDDGGVGYARLTDIGG